jgi:hypothetical protein
LLQQLVCGNVFLHRKAPKERARKRPPLGARASKGVGAGE